MDIFHEAKRKLVPVRNTVYQSIYKVQRRYYKHKIFCIGRNKTGTTSIQKALYDLGFRVGNQREAELLSNFYFEGNYEPIIDYCKKYQAFQDVPFSWPETYKYLDKAFPNSKFILTVRDSSEQWYQSYVKFQSKIFKNGNVPTWEDLRNTEYVYKGWAFNNRKKLYNLSEEDDPYAKSILIQHYEKHNNDVIDYFKDRKDDLLILNLADKDSYKLLCTFLRIKSYKNNFPWLNKT